MDFKRQARASAARKLADEMSQDMGTQHLPDEPEAVDNPVEEAQEPMGQELTPEDTEKLKQFVEMLK